VRRGAFLAGVASALAAIGVARPVPTKASKTAFTLPTQVRVHLFSGMKILRVDLSSAGPMVYSAGQTQRTGSSFSVVDASTPVSVTANAAVDVVAYRDDGTMIQRRYLGAFLFVASEGGIVAINGVDLESYVPSVMASEISAGWHAEALRAQAIAVRTYAARRATAKTAPTKAYDLTDDTSNQVYHGIDRIAASLADAASATAGQVMLFDGSPADLWYHSACGGHTAASVEVTAVNGPPYLSGVADIDASGRAYCASSPYWGWRNNIDAGALGGVIGPGSNPVEALSIVDRWPDGRVKTIRATFGGGSTTDMDGHTFYARAGAVLGYKVVPSAMFDVSGPTSDAFEISGRGVGHGVGMCQWGAQGRALAGETAAQILAAYFPGTVLQSR
jgi:stage II sporulation protein D